MSKCIHVVNIDNFFPELWEMTYPTIKAYADRIDSNLNIITTRQFPQFHINYEKMQVWEDGEAYKWNFLVDADVLIHKDFPDFSTIVPPYHIGFNDNYHASSKFNIDNYAEFLRDGRNVGIASNAVITHWTTHDLFKPEVTPWERQNVCKVRQGDIDEFNLSFNLAKYGLKYCGITWEEWQRYYFVHIGTGDKQEALRLAKHVLDTWKNDEQNIRRSY